MRFTFAAAAVALAMVPQLAAATVTTINFSPSSCSMTCTNGAFILANHGATTANVAVAYATRTSRGNGVITGTNLQYWSDSYSNSDAAYSGGGTGGVGEVVLLLLTPGTLTLRSVDFGGWPNRPLAMQYAVYSRDFSSTLIDSSLVTNPLALTTVNFNLTSTDALRFQFGPDGFNGGIQNVVYEFTPDGNVAVPEPASWAMLIAGFGLVGASARRRRALA
jgi:hypothetical protein